MIVAFLVSDAIRANGSDLIRVTHGFYGTYLVAAY